MPRLFICLLLFFANIDPTFAQQNISKTDTSNEFTTLGIPNIAGEIKVDGVLDDILLRKGG